ncbi:MAG: PilT/PilU family type 4a pilus ATPase [Symploca sp. SIO3C6]|uniref:PilT/PilU family type 4a pilus ATPase n=1 Tax=Symploca sp. SIO1C4 TaxID=2607765 RepID=A0A6B3NL53_9CYAN|nr:PilT/PilU family type 4a pilus ATPase [Symploca sp. SIO3C6]NER30864.1 PilT/PilU family type 4a pilus ATPase [Symploca sp. SIO1C4]NET05610.1 PilT/PilU family type 4a pilus ATPase [Symploca sp. SIO2B6]
MTDLQRSSMQPPPTHRIPPPPPRSSKPPQSSTRAVQQTHSTTQQLSQTTNKSGLIAKQSSVSTPPIANSSTGSTTTKASKPHSPSTTGSVDLASNQPTLYQIIHHAYEQGCSDVHLGVGEFPRLRNRGQMELTNYPETDQTTFMSWLREILSDIEIQRFQEHLEFDGATQYDFARVRLNIFNTLKGAALVMRLIPLKIMTIDELRLPKVFRDISDAHKGLVLVTGPTGSGKSTTLAAMVDYINKEHRKHIITIEDPIEFVHQSCKSLIKQREVGIHTWKFDNALKAALREDPDLILVGEMRDKETVNTALKAAQTGHLVMGTLHTNSAVKTIERILNLYSAEEQQAMRVALAESVVAVISQGLSRTTDGKRAAFHDILVNTETMKDYIRDGKYEEMTNLMVNGAYDGMVTMNQSLFNLYQEGRITEETAMELSPAHNEMAQMLRGRC